MEQRLERASARQMGQTRALVMTGLFAALGCVATLVLQIPSPTGGYLNLGDTVVILGAYLLGPALGAAAGGDQSGYGPAGGYAVPGGGEESVGDGGVRHRGRSCYGGGLLAV